MNIWLVKYKIKQKRGVLMESVIPLGSQNAKGMHY